MRGKTNTLAGMLDEGPSATASSTLPVGQYRSEKLPLGPAVAVATGLVVVENHDQRAMSWTRAPGRARPVTVTVWPKKRSWRASDIVGGGGGAVPGCWGCW